MRSVSELRVSQIRLYPIDRIPFQALFVARNLTALQETFHFKSVGPAEESSRPAVVFEVGDFTHEGREYPMVRLVIQPMKTLLTAFAPSPACTAAYGVVESFLGKIDVDRRFEGTSPVIMTEETSCALDLDLKLERLLSPAFLTLASKEVQEAVSRPDAVATISPARIALKVKYAVKDPELAKTSFSIADKVLFIEPRAHTSPGAQRFFTQSPTDSEAHLRLLESLEQAFGTAVSETQRSKKTRPKPQRRPLSE